MTPTGEHILSEASFQNSGTADEKIFSQVSRVKDYFLFAKFRLSFLVVFSAACGYAMATTGSMDWVRFSLFILGGFLITASSNGFNQVIEKDTDKLMERTKNRPLPTGRMSETEGLIAASAMALTGLFILFYYINPLTALISFFSIVLYTLAYTPMKKVSPFAVFVGAIPGGLPPLIGWIAVSGEFTFGAWLVFFIQFIWQFPHFWAIAWVLDEDYKKAGFRLLPSNGEKNRRSAFQIITYSLALIPIGLLPLLFGMTGIISAVIISVCGIIFSWQAVRLMQSESDIHARQLMFGSFIYLPIVLISLLTDKV